jgi:VanZ family protein
MRARYWLPPVVWMAVILLLSSDFGSAQHTGGILEPLIRAVWRTASPHEIEHLHGLVRKAAHVAEYAVLALLWFRAFAAGSRWPTGLALAAAVTACASWAAVDEAHQSLYTSRGASVMDVALDTAAAVAAAIAVAAWRSAARRWRQPVLAGVRPSGAGPAYRADHHRRG